MGPVQVTLYGLGGMIGSGIYSIFATATGTMGSAVWLAFGVSMIAALLTGLSYACLGSRYPRAAGAAYITQRAYGRPLLSYVVGLAVMCSGLTSIATQSRVVGEYFQRQIGVAELPVGLFSIGFLLILGGVVFRGIRQSMWLNILCTSIEAAGLIVIVAAGARFWGAQPLLELPPGPEGEAGSLHLSLLMQAAVLTFFSFIGFEDILNVSEEVKNPRRNVPLGLICAMIGATILYMAVAITAVSVIHWRQLQGQELPLVGVAVRAMPWFNASAVTAVFAAISIFAVTNTALLNWVMGSRMAYGMARQGLLPAPLGRVHRVTRTPHIAIAALFVIAAALALVGGIGQLAAATTLLLLLVFSIVNLALIVLKLRPGEDRGSFEVPVIIPALGALVCAALLVNRVIGGDWRAPATAAGLLGVILVLYLVLRPKIPSNEPVAAP